MNRWPTQTPTIRPHPGYSEVCSGTTGPEGMALSKEVLPGQEWSLTGLQYPCKKARQCSEAY